ncbi:hypothetical protein DFW101_2943 [Solidesulfovibrio carbinoliphilus subsp. oakridgensis]|uniref:Uncharacterized protein n=1 Tax=Solidesulfovibrio carbinoliphilus subsp. oakridgensis TaxID=694327 RepID=G7Q5E4_9BACT|nr:hypothetical protein [Solidesulfovibrio carbinoliphilus]EHJ48945.1 hypothetical protein DFW101_2943 [Solidesulfovibrio carbinoliphilus subsp. oakridgensis]
MCTTNATRKENVLEIDFNQGLAFALAEVVHGYVAAMKLPVDAALSINMTVVIDAGHYDVSNGDAFGEIYGAMDVNLQL